MSTPTRHTPSRRTLLRTAVWTAPAVSIAVAAPAYAASHVVTCTISGTRTGANFYVTVGCNVEVTSVQVGSTPAVWNGEKYHAQMSGVGQIGSTQDVTIMTKHGTVTQSVTKSVTFTGK